MNPADTTAATLTAERAEQFVACLVEFQQTLSDGTTHTAKSTVEEVSFGSIVLSDPDAGSPDHEPTEFYSYVRLETVTWLTALDGGTGEPPADFGTRTAVA